jgi:vacuolar-type H+-ATPase subunit F/Vma7
LIVSSSDRSEDVDRNTETDLCNGSDTSSPSTCTQPSVNGNENEISDSVDAASSVSTPSVGNVLFVGNLKNIGKGDNQRKVYLVNSSVLKSNNIESTAVKNVTTVPSFVPLSQSNMKSISRNITLNVTPTSTNSVLLKPNKQSYEILRAKLMENRVENSEPTLVEIPTIPTKTKTILKTSINTSFVNIPKSMHESPAVTEARNDFIRCRKKLIEAAIYPKLTTKVPLAGYIGPTFSCEECEDT